MMRHQALPESFRRELRMYFMQRRFASQLVRFRSLLEGMSPALRARVVRFQVDEFLVKVPYLQESIGGKDALLVRLQQSLVDTLFAPKELLDLPQSLCCLHRGLALKGVSLLCRGAVWGDGDVLLNDFMLLDQVVPVAVSYVEVLC